MGNPINQDASKNYPFFLFACWNLAEAWALISSKQKRRSNGLQTRHESLV